MPFQLLIGKSSTKYQQKNSEWRQRSRSELKMDQNWVSQVSILRPGIHELDQRP